MVQIEQDFGWDSCSYFAIQSGSLISVNTFMHTNFMHFSECFFFGSSTVSAVNFTGKHLSAGKLLVLLTL